VRFLLVPVADDETLVAQAAEVLTGNPLFGPVCEVTVDLIDEELVTRVTAINAVRESRNG